MWYQSWKMVSFGRMAAVCAVVALSACGDKTPILMHAEQNASSDGPDEFSVLPQHALVDPPSYASLPTPNPGGTNLADIDPAAEVAIALGGRASATRPTGQVQGGPLMTYASRFGVAENIRNILAAEDLEYRRDHNTKPLERIFAVNVYFSAYAPMTLDQYAEWQRLLSLGIATPAAPPEPDG
jgi:predicted small lipoprotein YifL